MNEKEKEAGVTPAPPAILELGAKAYAAVVGAKVVATASSVRDSEDTEPDDVRLGLSDGRVLRLWLDGDCCSHSYFTDAKQFAELIGATILSVEERDGAVTDDSEVSWHFLVFVTDKGHVTIDWRNDSNGYYDGSINPVLEAAP